MTMQTDVRQARLTQSGWLVSGPCRVKSIAIRGGTGAGYIALFDTTAAPVSATYAQSGTTVTVTKNAHGLSAGQQIGIEYQVGTGGSATTGNYTIATATTNTFTIVDPNTNSVTAGAACSYVSTGEWMLSMTCADGDIYINNIPIPGEGVRAYSKVYVSMTNLDAMSAYYG